MEVQAKMLSFLKLEVVVDLVEEGEQIPIIVLVEMEQLIREKMVEVAMETVEVEVEVLANILATLEKVVMDFNLI